MRKLNLLNFSVIRFFSEIKEELKKVVWPSKKETMRLTTVVLVASLVVALFIGGVDFIFTNIFSLILKR